MIFYYKFVLCIFIIPVQSYIPSNSYYPDNRNSKDVLNRFEESLIDHCYLTINGLNVVFGNWKVREPSYLLKFSREDLKISLSHEDRFFKLKENHQVPLTATKFFIESLTLESLMMTLKVLKDSLYWNLHGLYLVKTTLIYDTCTLVPSIFKTFWDFKVLNVVYMCYDISDGMSLYTYNPYNEVAPQNWRKVETLLQENAHPLNLFKMLVNDTVAILPTCRGLMYDKTNNISQYPIRIAEPSLPIKLLDSPNKLELDILTWTVKFVRIVLEKLEAKIIATPISLLQLGTVTENRKYVGTFKDIFDGTLDLRSLSEIQRAWQYEAYVYGTEAICYATRKYPVSLSEQLSVILPLSIRMMFILLLCIIAIIFTYILRLDYVNNLLEILRALLGSPTLHTPNSTVKSLVFISIIYSFILINVCLQSLLSALLSTTEVQTIEITSSEDLEANDNFKIYGSSYIKQYFVNSSLFGKIATVNYPDECFNLIKTKANVHNIVCVHSCLLAKFEGAGSNEVHISEDKFLNGILVFFFREDSPFIQTFQYISHRLGQAGILQYVFSITKFYSMNQTPSNSVTHSPSIYILKVFFFTVAMHFVGFLVFLIEVSIRFKKYLKVQLF